MMNNNKTYITLIHESFRSIFNTSIFPFCNLQSKLRIRSCYQTTFSIVSLLEFILSNCNHFNNLLRSELPYKHTLNYYREF